MPNPEEYDLVVLGSGEAGKYLAWTAASQGKRAAVIERRYIGGSCPNISCLPSKNIIYAAKVASLLRRGREFGVPAFDGAINMAAVQTRKQEMVEGLVEMHLEKYRASGAELVMGHGRFTGPKTIDVALIDGGTRVLRGSTIVINTGSRATINAIPGLREAAPLTHTEALELDRVPDHLIVIGGGHVGLELAQAFRRFGSRVTIIERNHALIHREDSDVSEAMRKLFMDEGIELFTDTAVSRITGTSGAAVSVQGVRQEEEIVLEGSHLLVATGRTPNTDEIGLETAGVEVNARGHIRVNEFLQTTAANVWAVGDCAGSPYFTHIGFDDFRVVQDNLAGGNRSTIGRQVPSCLFTDPEMARIGLREREALERGIPYRLFNIPMVSVLRTRTLSETRGFMKALVKMDDRILGFAAFGAGAGEVMAVVQVAMAANLPFTALRDAVLTHPTIAEGLIALFSAAPEMVAHDPSQN